MRTECIDLVTNKHMLFKLPPEVVMLAIDAHILQNKGTVGSVESRSLEVQRKQHQLAELVSAIIIKEWNDKTKKLPK